MASRIKGKKQQSQASDPPTSRSEDCFLLLLFLFWLLLFFSSQAPYKLSGVSGSYSALKTLLALRSLDLSWGNTWGYMTYLSNQDPRLELRRRPYKNENKHDLPMEKGRRDMVKKTST